MMRGKMMNSKAPLGSRTALSPSSAPRSPAWFCSPRPARLLAEHLIMHLCSPHSLATVILAALAAIPSKSHWMPIRRSCAAAPVIAAAVLAAKSMRTTDKKMNSFPIIA